MSRSRRSDALKHNTDLRTHAREREAFINNIYGAEEGAEEGGGGRCYTASPAPRDAHSTRFIHRPRAARTHRRFPGRARGLNWDNLAGVRLGISGGVTGADGSCSSEPVCFQQCLPLVVQELIKYDPSVQSRAVCSWRIPAPQGAAGRGCHRQMSLLLKAGLFHLNSPIYNEIFKPHETLILWH